MASAIESVSAGILGTLGKNTKRSFDPSILISIGEVLIELFKKCQESKNAAQLAQSARSPRLLERLAVRRQVKAQLSVVEFHQFGEELVEAVLAEGKKATTGKVEQLLADINSL